MSGAVYETITPENAEMVTTSKKKEPVRVKWTDGQVVIEPKDNDLFAITAQHAIEGCRWRTKITDLAERFKEEFIERVHKWCVDHASIVKSCYIGNVGGEGVPVYVVGQAEGYDFELGEEIANLQSTLHNAGWCTQVLQIPVIGKEELESFFIIEEAIEVYAKTEATSGQSRQEQKVS